MNSPRSCDIQELHFSYLQRFAQYILDFRLEEYLREELRISREVNLPVMRALKDMTDEQILGFVRSNTERFLKSVASNQVKEYMERGVQQWLNNQLPLIDQEQISLDDLALVHYIRKKSCLTFLPQYFEDTEEFLAALGELDLLLLENARVLQVTYVNILQKKIDSQNHFQNLIFQTIPGVIYIYDINTLQTVFLRGKIRELLGAEAEENLIEGSSFVQYILEEDREILERNLDLLRSGQFNGVVRTELEFTGPNREPIWIRTNEAVFRTDDHGIPDQIIGIAFDIQEIKQAEIALRDSELQLLEAQQLSAIGSFVWDLKNPHNNRFSPIFKEIIDLPEHSTLDDFLQHVHPGDRDRLKHSLKVSIATGDPFHCEYRFFRRGEERVLDSRGRFVSDSNQEPSLLRGTVMDVTDKTRTINRLIESEELFKQAQALSSIGNFSWNADQQYMNWSEELYRIYGLSSDEKIDYERFLELVYPDDRSAVEDALDRCVDEAAAVNYRHRIVRSDGKIRTIQGRASSIVDNDKKFIKIIGTGQDITDELETSRELMQKQSFIEKLADATPSLISCYNIHSGKYVFVNQSLETLLGYKVEDLMREGVSLLIQQVHPEDLELLTEQNSRAIDEANRRNSGSEEAVHEFKYRVKAADGNYVWLHTYETVFDRNASGEVEHIMNISLNITAIMEAEERISAKNRELEQSNSNLEEFAYIASHDLKEPLRKISSFGDRLLQTQAEKLDERGKMYLDRIIDSSKRMQQLINDLLAVSVISGNHEFEEADLSELLDDAIKPLDLKIEKLGADIQTVSLPKAKVVPSQIRQLFQNLISNSLKFHRQEVPLVISVRCKNLSPQDIRKYLLDPARHYFQLSIEDNGIGFSNQYSEKIFAIFNRLHGRSEYEGTGIGLAICKKIVSHHEGLIFAEGVENKGSSFHIILPY